MKHISDDIQQRVLNEVDAQLYVDNLRTLLKTKPVFVIEKAVKGMLPANSLGRAAFTRLHVYAGAEHKHAAQKPEAREI